MASGQQRLPLEQALLGFLSQEPMHGYDLHRRAQDELGRIWQMGIGNIYDALKRLEQAGHVESTLSPQENRPTRKVYRITRSGRGSFWKWLQQPVPNIRRLRVELLAKLYFIHTLGLNDAQKLIAAQETVCRKRIEWLEHSAAQCDPQAFDRLVFDFRQRQIEAILGWLQAYRERIAS